MRSALVLLLVLISGTPVQAQEPPPKPEIDLRLPTTFYLTTSAVDWATAAPACQLGCQTRMGLLPHVPDARVSIPIGLLIDVGVIWLTHKVIGPRWPKVAEGLLYTLSVVKVVSATNHLTAQREWNRRTTTGPCCQP